MEFCRHRIESFYVFSFALNLLKVETAMTHLLDGVTLKRDMNVGHFTTLGVGAIKITLYLDKSAGNIALM